MHSTLKVPPSVLASKIPKRRIIKNLLVVLELRIVLVGKSECRQTGPTLITKALELCMQTATYCGQQPKRDTKGKQNGSSHRFLTARDAF